MSALCKCGCGREVLVADRNRSEYGWVKGQPKQFVRGHNPRNGVGARLAREGFKWCSKCGVEKPHSEFYRTRAKHVRNDGWQSRCKTCSHLSTRDYRRKNVLRIQRYMYDRRLMKTFGITRTTYDSMLASQQGACAICKTAASAHVKSGRVIKMMPVDHDHRTGQIRGILCDHCNRGLGLLGEENLEAALAYLASAQAAQLKESA